MVSAAVIAMHRVDMVLIILPLLKFPASEHTITAKLKDLFRYVIRENRQKHNMHIDPNNLDVIVKCTHCWWNPINASVLRPYIKNSEYEHILFDKESLGLKGTTNGKNADAI
jgi:hypothetical protein